MVQHKTYADAIRERNELLFDHECPTCGWNAITKEGLKQGYCDVIRSQTTNTDFGPGFEIYVGCTCPICGTEFEYSDGSP